jgi:hypothetical protein
MKGLGVSIYLVSSTGDQITTSQINMRPVSEKIGCQALPQQAGPGRQLVLANNWLF